MNDFFELSEKAQTFIKNHLQDDVKNLAFHNKDFSGEEFHRILYQIQSKQKSKLKLPLWFSTSQIVFPKPISVEQTSSELLALYKSEQISGNQLIDLTGGFGVDTYFFSKKFTKVYHCEQNEELSKITKHNFKVLKALNICCFAKDSMEVLKSSNTTFDWIYLDPARRNQSQKKVFLLEDCTPNVIENIDFYFNYADSILIKTAPLLDIKQGIESLKYVYKIEIVSLNNEVKEILWFLNKNIDLSIEEIELWATNIDKNNQQKTYKTKVNFHPNILYHSVKKYLFEPFNALLKTGNFNAIAIDFNIEKLAPHSHLYTNEHLIDFPGRSFEVQKQIPFKKKQLKAELYGLKANITTRNFPLKTEEIRKQYKISDGGELYLFFTTNNCNEKIVIFCTKVNGIIPPA